jgi:lycopene beta-cyclase
MPTYDFILAGGGAAGLSLAYHLVHSPLKDASILIVDPESKDANDRTWSFWTHNSSTFDAIVHRSWDCLQFVGEGLDKTLEISPYRYQMIRGLDFYRHVHQALAAFPNVEFLQGKVTHIQDGPGFAEATVEGQTFQAAWIFDSRPAHPEVNTSRYHALRLYFKGWAIQTAGPAFTPQAATLMDFRTPQRGDTRFFYVLPFSEDRALVEYTVFTASRVGAYECQAALENYLAGVQGIGEYHILSAEGGCIPVTDQPAQRRAGARVMNIGARGGRIKPTTGYAFARIQQDSIAIVRSLVEQGSPFHIPADSERYRLLDSILMEIMTSQGEEIQPIFTALFRNNPPARLFRFLDEVASPQEILMLIETLPRRIFLETLLKMQRRQRLSWRQIRDFVTG